MKKRERNAIFEDKQMGRKRDNTIEPTKAIFI